MPHVNNKLWFHFVEYTHHIDIDIENETAKRKSNRKLYQIYEYVFFFRMMKAFHHHFFIRKFSHFDNISISFNTSAIRKQLFFAPYHFFSEKSDYSVSFSNTD